MRTLETIPTGPHEAEIVSTAAIQETYPKDYEAMLAAGSALAQESRGRQYLLRMKSLSDFGKIKAIIPPDVAGARLLMNTEALQQLHGSAKNIATGIRKALQAALENKNIPEGEKTIGVLGMLRHQRRQKLKVFAWSIAGIATFFGGQEVLQWLHEYQQANPDYREVISVFMDIGRITFAVASFVSLCFTIGAYFEHLTSKTEANIRMNYAVYRLLAEVLDPDSKASDASTPATSVRTGNLLPDTPPPATTAD